MKWNGEFGPAGAGCPTLGSHWAEAAINQTPVGLAGAWGVVPDGGWDRMLAAPS